MMKLTLKTKIYGMLILFTGGMVCSTTLFYFKLSRTAEGGAAFADQQLRQQNDVRVVQLTFKKQVQAWKDILLRGSDPEALAKYKGEFQRLQAEVDERAQALKDQIQDSETRAKIDGFLAAHSQLDSEYGVALAMFENSHGKDFASADKQVKGKDRPPTDAIDSIVEDLSRLGKQTEEDNAREVRGSSRWLAAGIALLNVGLLALGAYIAGSISASTAGLVAHTSEQANAVHDGRADLTQTIAVTSSDEFGEIANSFNTFTAAVREILLRLSSHGDQLASASEEISSGASLSSEASRTQAAQAQEAATAVQEMSTTGQEISQHAREAAEAARKAAESAHRGGTVVQQTLTTMKSVAESSKNVSARISELGKSSQQIGKIIEVIDGIADQTNMLALNAAIEAARAGEQGRGFAVVADEVRKLAERTSTATKEIALMVESIQTDTQKAVQAMEVGTRAVEVGVTETSKSGETLQELIKISDELGEMIMQIATAAGEQSTATNQINSSMTRISESIQQSATAATQTAKACADLSGLALDLQTLVRNFKLVESNSGRDELRDGAKLLAFGKAAGAR
ncbi:MAG TPA: methyl-accepting chemotaxis protein [Candidatus Solibacter sp.]|nr:methyl-accepting chemotaxis protein [Candidatus Solibacter sp.]